MLMYSFNAVKILNIIIFTKLFNIIYYFNKKPTHFCAGSLYMAGSEDYFTSVNKTSPISEDITIFIAFIRIS